MGAGDQRDCLAGAGGPVVAKDGLSYSILAKELFAGGFAGTCGVFIGIPLDFVKTRTQLFPDVYKGPLDCALKTLKNEGIKGFYKGMWSPLAAQFFVNALAFAGESMTMRAFNAYDERGQWHSLAKGCVAGGFGGLLTTLATVPTDLVKVRMQADNANSKPRFNSTAQCVMEIFRKDGFFGFYKGMGVTIVREIPSFAAYFLCYDLMVQSLTQPGEKPDTMSILFSGGCAGCASWVPIYPMDVIKTYIQNNPEEKVSAVKVARTLYQKHGLHIFWRGVGPVIVRAFPVNGATFYVYEDVKGRMGIDKYSNAS